MSAAHLASERRAILDTALRHAAFDGWTQRTLRQAVREAGFEVTMARRAFPGGGKELIAFFMAETDRRLAMALDPQELAGLRIRERIARIVRTRLELLAPHREAVRRALASGLLPGRRRGTLKGLARAVDLMWHLAGDTATDFNWYTKRALLAGVHATTLFFWLGDDSDGFEETWAFLDRRIEDVMRIQKARGRFDKAVERLPKPLAMLARLRHGRARSAQT